MLVYLLLIANMSRDILLTHHRFPIFTNKLMYVAIFVILIRTTTINTRLIYLIKNQKDSNPSVLCCLDQRLFLFVIFLLSLSCEQRLEAGLNSNECVF